MIDDLVRPLRVVSLYDPAIDWVAMAREGVTPRSYAEDRDETTVRVIPGMSPQWCTLRPLTGADCMYIDEAGTNEALKMWRSFSLAVSEVQSFEAPGVALRPTVPAPVSGGGSRLVWDNPGIERIATMLGMQFIYEMGQLAYQRVHAGNGRSGGVLFTPPLFLEPVLGQIARRVVAQQMADVGTRSSAPSAPAATTTSSPTSDAATDARAESGDAPPAERGPTTSSATKESASSSR